MKSSNDAVKATYGTKALTQRLLESLTAAGCDIDHLSSADLITFDELHVMGRLASREMGGQASLHRGMRVLDIGCGLGGTARTLAAEFGCRVTGVDLSAEFVETARELTRRVGLDHRVSYRHADALDLPFEDDQFDAVMFLHVNMNIADKDRLFTEARRVAKTEGTVHLWELSRGENPNLIFPVPWAENEAFSFLVSADQLRAYLTGSGLEILTFEDTTDEAVGWIRQRQTSAKPRTAKPPRPDLDLVLRDFRQKRTNVAKNLMNGSIRLVRAVARKH